MSTTAMGGDAAAFPGLRVTDAAGILVVSDENTTVGYCRYSGDGEIEYVFVQAARRRQGTALRLLAMVEGRLGLPLRFREPLSPSGRQLVAAHMRKGRSPIPD